jgi:hypothetical protein
VNLQGLLPPELVEGPCWFYAEVDRDLLIDEVDENDNWQWVQSTAKKGVADLVVGGLSVEQGTFPGGSTIEVSAIVQNLGTGPAPSSHCGIVIHAHAGTPKPDDYWLGGFETGTLLPNESAPLKQRYLTPFCLPSHLRGSDILVGAYADLGRVVPESSETNNGQLQAIRTIGSSTGVVVEWVPHRATSPDITKTTPQARIPAQNPPRVGMCLLASQASHHLGLYVLIWSGSPGVPVQIDDLSLFGLALLNTPVFAGWLGQVNGNAVRLPSLGLPPVSIGAPLSIYTHGFFLDRGFQLLGTTASGIELQLH